ASVGGEIQAIAGKSDSVGVIVLAEQRPDEYSIFCVPNLDVVVVSPARSDQTGIWRIGDCGAINFGICFLCRPDKAGAGLSENRASAKENEQKKEGVNVRFHISCFASSEQGGWFGSVT